MVANNNFQVELGIVSSFLAFAMIFRSLEFIFNDANLIFQIHWDSMSKLPTDSMNGWDIRSRRFAQNTMAIKRFDKDSFVTFMGLEQKQGLAIRLDIFGIPLNERFDYRKLNLDLSLFVIEDE